MGASVKHNDPRIRQIRADARVDPYDIEIKARERALREAEEAICAKIFDLMQYTSCEQFNEIIEELLIPRT